VNCVLNCILIVFHLSLRPVCFMCFKRFFVCLHMFDALRFFCMRCYDKHICIAAQGRDFRGAGGSRLCVLVKGPTKEECF